MKEGVGHAGGIGHLQLHLVVETAGGDLSQTDALALPWVSLVRSRMTTFSASMPPEQYLGWTKRPETLGVHAVAGDVLADLVHHQHVALVKEEGGRWSDGDLSLSLGSSVMISSGAQALDEVEVSYRRSR